MLKFNFKSPKGQSILEVIVAMAIFSLIASSMAAMAVGGFTALTQGGEQIEAANLAQEGIEAVRAIRDRAWNKNIYSKSSVAINAGEWVFSGEGTEETIGQYTRVITFSDVCRDALDEIVACPGSYNDVHSKKVTVAVSWPVRSGVVNSVQKISYLTNWDSKEWVEDVLTDFEDGTFNNTATSTIFGDGDGAVILETQ